MVSTVTPAHSRRLMADDDEEDKTSVTWQFLPFIGCEDENNNKIDTNSAKACLDECENDEACRAFSYNVVDGRCYTKLTECVEQTQNPDNFSAVKLSN